MGAGKGKIGAESIPGLVGSYDNQDNHRKMTS